MPFSSVPTYVDVETLGTRRFPAPMLIADWFFSHGNSSIIIQYTNEITWQIAGKNWPCWPVNLPQLVDEVSMTWMKACCASMLFLCVFAKQTMGKNNKESLPSIIQLWYWLPLSRFFHLWNPSLLFSTKTRPFHQIPFHPKVTEPHLRHRDMCQVRCPVMFSKNPRCCHSICILKISSLITQCGSREKGLHKSPGPDRSGLWKQKIEGHLRMLHPSCFSCWKK